MEIVDGSGAPIATIGEYFYDGDGKRVKKVIPNGETTIFVYDAFGKMVAEYSTVVASQQNAKVSYLTSDNLGSPRINTDQNGGVTARHDYHSFGGEIARASYGGDSVRKKFTGYERDIESELDFAQARYHDYDLGRFQTPDPLMASAQRINPQTLNRYSYVINNPLRFTDSSGLVMDTCPPVCPSFLVVPDKGQLRGNITTITVRASDTPQEPIETTPFALGTSITPRSLEQIPAAGFVGPPPVVSPGVKTPVTMPPSGSPSTIGRAVGLLGRALLASMLAPAAIILATPTTIQAPAPVGPTTTTTTDDKEDDRNPWQNVYRVAGGDSPLTGQWWSPINPRAIPDYRDAVHLPDTNSGEFLVEGTVRSSNIILSRLATPKTGVPRATEILVKPGSVKILGIHPLRPPL